VQIIIIGSGPAAFAAVQAILDQDPSITPTIVAPSTSTEAHPFEGTPPSMWPDKAYDELNTMIKKKSGSSFMPVRSHFGNMFTSWKGTPLIKSDYFGGLGKFWSCGMFPLSPSELIKWPFTYEEIQPFYKRIGEVVGISGKDDQLNDYFGDSFATRPPVYKPPIAQKFYEKFSQIKNKHPDFRFSIGVNRLALETRVENEKSCINCGYCMYGCFKKSLFNPADSLKEFEEDKRIKIINDKALGVFKTIKGWDVKLANNQTIQADKVFLCAGAIGTSEILLRSFSLFNKEVFIDDNENYLFGLISNKAAKKNPSSFSFGTLTLGVLSKDKYAQASLTTLPDMFLDYIIPRRINKYLQPFFKIFQNRILLGRLHIDGLSASKYSMSLTKEGVLNIKQVRTKASDTQAKKILKALDINLKGTNFRRIKGLMIHAPSSAHYVGGFANGEHGVCVKADGVLKEGLYVCDSSAFPANPSQPLTFTIMANAMRVVTKAIKDRN